MTRYVLGRLAALLLTLVLALSGLYALLHAAPGQPTANFGAAVAADPEARAAIEQARGLDRPFLAQYLEHLGGVLRGDLGRSYYDGSDVRSQLATAAPVSIELGLLATVLAILPGVLLGTFAARRRGRRGDGLASGVALVAVSLPSYWLAVVALVVAGERWPHLLPSAGGYVPFTEAPLANLQVMVLPAVVVGLGGFALVVRAVRSSLGDALEEDDATFARACGMDEGQIVTSVAGRRAAPAVLAVSGLVVGGLLTGTVLVETVFALPGLGNLLVTSFVRGDHPVAMGAALVTALVLLVINLLVDTTIVALDRRLLAEGRRS
jgi:peptide/nickel transport system permease protein